MESKRKGTLTYLSFSHHPAKPVTIHHQIIGIALRIRLYIKRLHLHDQPAHRRVGLRNDVRARPSVVVGQGVVGGLEHEVGRVEVGVARGDRAVLLDHRHHVPETAGLVVRVEGHGHLVLLGELDGS